MHFTFRTNLPEEFLKTTFQRERRERRPGVLLSPIVKGTDFVNQLRLLDGQLRLRMDEDFSFASPEQENVF